MNLDELNSELAKKLNFLVPQTYGEAVVRHGKKIINCLPHEWDNRTALENIRWLIWSYRNELKRLEKERT